jgi:hypothetical protein
MAQNNIQKYDDVTKLGSGLRNTVSTFYNTMDQMERLSTFLNSAEAADYPGYDVGTLSDMGALRNAINAHMAATETVALMASIKKFIQI